MFVVVVVYMEKWKKAREDGTKNVDNAGKTKVEKKQRKQKQLVINKTAI